MNELPKIHKTYLFSDIEGSTRLALKLGEGYALVLNRYRNIFQSAIGGFQGRVVDTAGDGFFAVFENMEGALAFAATLQRAYSAVSWVSGITLRVRIGLHFGEAIISGNGFIGLEVHRASRVCNAAHGGQVLLSRAAADVVMGKPLKGLSIQPLGTFLLKDFEEPEPLFQLVIQGLPGDFPPPRTEAAPSPTIAVLPFLNLSGDPGQDFLCEGIAEEIIITLGKIPDLRVVPRSASFAIKNKKDWSLAETARHLNASYLLEGTVKRYAQQLRIHAELIDAEKGVNLWSGRFDRGIADIFAIQDEIAQNISSTLKIKLGALQVRHISDVQTRNVNAYDHYIRGRRHYNQFSLKGVKTACTMYEKAVQQDENYALAYCGLSEVYAYLYMYESPSPDNLFKARSYSARAMQIDPLLARAYVSRGVALSLEYNMEDSEALFEQAIALDPQLFEAWYWYGRICFVQGKLEKAAHLFETANRVQPEDFQSALLAAQVYADLGLAGKAREAWERAVQIASHYLELNPDDPRAYYSGANGLMALGETAQSLEWLQKALALDPNDGMLLYNAGCIYAMAGLKDRAFNALTRSVDAGLNQVAWFANDSNLDTLRDDPRFMELMDKMQAPGR
ncbi:MAG: TPR end-of-group domain-containing protein [Saprospiraceae bacterium]|jgi:adenylate cyclase